MKRLLLITLLLLSRAPAYAEWVPVADHDQAGTTESTSYVNPDTIHRNGDRVKMWVLFDYKTIQHTAAGNSFLSSKQQSECDCTEKRFRLLIFTHLSGNMGGGNVVYSHPGSGKWVPVALGSVGQSLWEVACGKK